LGGMDMDVKGKMTYVAASASTSKVFYSFVVLAIFMKIF